MAVKAFYHTIILMIQTGNITEIKQNGKLTNKYVYDSLNELKEEYDYINKFYINYSYGGVKTNYYYDSNKNLITLVKGNDTLLFYYDSDGSATSFSYNGTMYFYVKNLQWRLERSWCMENCEGYG